MPRSIKKFITNGPWVGGLASKPNPKFLSDEQLFDIRNFDIDIDGTLVPRMPIRAFNEGLGALAANEPYLVGSFDSGRGSQRIAVVKDADSLQFYFFGLVAYSATPTLTTFTGLVRQDGYYTTINYNGYIYVLNCANAAQSFRFPDGFTSGAVTLLPNVPLADTSTGDSNIPNTAKAKAFMFKDRMWVIGANNRVYYSKVTDPTIWAAPDGGFFDVEPGFGDSIQCVAVTNDSIYFFKHNSTWVFSYTSDPATDGYLRVISTTKGAIDCVVYNNEIYTVDSKSIYQFSNGLYTDLAENLDFGNMQYPSLVVWDTKVLLNPSGNSLTYVLSLITGTWTTYDTITWAGPGGDPGDPTLQAYANYVRDFYKATEFYYSGGEPFLFLESRNNNILHYFDPTLAGDPDLLKKIDENGYQYVFPQYKFVTKEFTFDDLFHWKRFYNLRVQGDPLIAADQLTETPVGFWYFSIDGVSWTALNQQDFNRIVTPSFRFRSLQLAWIAVPRVVDVDFDKYTDYGSFGNLPVPRFHKIGMNISLKGETS